MRHVLRIHPDDDLVVALVDLPSGESIDIDGEPLVLCGAVAAKHKVATRDFEVGDGATMYGVRVGRTTRAIRRGEPVGTHNLTHDSASYEGKKADRAWTPPQAHSFGQKTFQGFVREDGRVGTANHWLIIPLVFCESRNVRLLRNALREAVGLRLQNPLEAYAQSLRSRSLEGASLEELGELAPPPPADLAMSSSQFPNLSGIQLLEHDGGCGGTYEDSAILCRLLIAYITHPNTLGVTVLSLGCQHAQIDMMKEALPSGHQRPVFFYEQQKWRSEQAMLEAALKDAFLAIQKTSGQGREEVPLSKLTLGLECGGSDGFSGITANPTIGRVSDLLVSCHGSAILAEFPELCGVEQDLLDRCRDEESAQRFVSLMRAYEASAQAVGSGFDSNPSPGNIADGLITDAMKSAGAARKGGSSPISAVLDYPEAVRKSGLHLLCTPGNDVESTTALAAAGANVILFSTGLGTPTGNPVTPVIKISSNTKLATEMSDIIDFDTGTILDGSTTPDELGERLLDLTIDVASGRATPRAVAKGQSDFIPWKRGVSL